jgi:hypothetical protein
MATYLDGRQFSIDVRKDRLMILVSARTKTDAERFAKLPDQRTFTAPIQAPLYFKLAFDVCCLTAPEITGIITSLNSFHA